MYIFLVYKQYLYQYIYNNNVCMYVYQISLEFFLYMYECLNYV